MFTKDLPTPIARFIESIRCVCGEPQLLPLHEERMLRTLSVFAPEGGLNKRLRARGLIDILSPYITELSTEPCVKLRYLYDAEGIYALSHEVYTPRVIRHIRLVELPDSASYTHKWEDRRLLEVAALASDEEVLFVRRGLLTDTRFSNIVLRLGSELLTPSEPLLRGVMREHLLRSGRIRSARLTPQDWAKAEAHYLINAMLPLPLEA